LRYFTVAGRLVLTPEEANLEEIRKAETERERAETERQRAETERERAETERERANKLAEYLRSLGVDPDSVVN
jgi:dienelactone hydrolase